MKDEWSASLSSWRSGDLVTMESRHTLRQQPRMFGKPRPSSPDLQKSIGNSLGAGHDSYFTTTFPSSHSLYLATSSSSIKTTPLDAGLTTSVVLQLYIHPSATILDSTAESTESTPQSSIGPSSVARQLSHTCFGRACLPRWSSALF